MKRALAASLAAVVLAACAGRDPQPVAISRESDERMDCQQIATELTDNDQEIARLTKESDKTYQNSFFGAAAAVLIVPALYLDTGHAERDEAAALEQRKQHLLSIANEKQCGFNVPPPDAPKP